MAQSSLLCMVLHKFFTQCMIFQGYHFHSHIQMPRINFVFHQKHHIRAWLGLQQIFVFLDNQNHPKFKESNKCARFDISLLFCFHGHFVSILFFVSFFNFWESWSLYFSTLANFDFMTTFPYGATNPNLCQNFILKDCSPINGMREATIFLIGLLLKGFKRKYLYIFCAKWLKS